MKKIHNIFVLRFMACIIIIAVLAIAPVFTTANNIIGKIIGDTVIGRVVGRAQADDVVIPKNFGILTNAEFQRFIAQVENSPQIYAQIKKMADINADAMEIIAEIANKNDKKKGVAVINRLQKAYDMGSARAGFKIALIFYVGSDGIETDISKSLEYLDKAAKMGSLEATIMVANIYRNGDNVPRDIQKTLEYYDLPGVALNAITNYNRATIYYNGDGVPVDMARAKKYYEIAAQRNFLDSREMAEKIRP